MTLKNKILGLSLIGAGLVQMIGGTVFGMYNARQYRENQAGVERVEQGSVYSSVSDSNFLGATAGITAIMFSGYPIWYGMAVRRRED